MSPTGEIYACTGRQDAPHVTLGARAIESAMADASPEGCEACLCGGNLELNLLLEQGLRGLIREVPTLLSWSR